MNIHIVKSGETAASIAEQYGVPEFVVVTLNNLEEIPTLVEGQALLILEPTQIHTVSANETIYSIAQSPTLLNNLQASSKDNVLPDARFNKRCTVIPLKRGGC